MGMNQSPVISSILSSSFLNSLVNLGNICCILCPIFITEKINPVQLNTLEQYLKLRQAHAALINIEEQRKNIQQLLETIKNSLTNLVDINLLEKTKHTKHKLVEWLKRTTSTLPIVKNMIESVIESGLFINFHQFLCNLNSKIPNKGEAKIHEIQQNIQIILDKSNEVYFSFKAQDPILLNKILAENYSFFQTIMEFMDKVLQEEDKEHYTFENFNANNVFCMSLAEEVNKIKLMNSTDAIENLEQSAAASYKTKI